jgi:hypothetical protein
LSESEFTKFAGFSEWKNCVFELILAFLTGKTAHNKKPTFFVIPKI